MSAKHTPGPWSVGSHRSIQSASGTICETYSHMGIAEADSNERLIAAAPELLAIVARIVNDGLSTSLVKDARAAIAKATGEQQ